MDTLAEYSARGPEMPCHAMHTRQNDQGQVQIQSLRSWILEFFAMEEPLVERLELALFPGCM
jgi:hypothetical protein